MGLKNLPHRLLPCGISSDDLFCRVERIFHITRVGCAVLVRFQETPVSIGQIRAFDPQFQEFAVAFTRALFPLQAVILVQLQFDACKRNDGNQGRQQRANGFEWFGVAFDPLPHRLDRGLLLSRAMDAAADLAKGIDIQRNDFSIRIRVLQCLQCCAVGISVTEFGRNHCAVADIVIRIGSHEIRRDHSYPGDR